VGKRSRCLFLRQHLGGVLGRLRLVHPHPSRDRPVCRFVFRVDLPRIPVVGRFGHSPHQAFSPKPWLARGGVSADGGSSGGVRDFD